MPKIIKLKPCPFCGAEGDSFVSLNKRYDNHFVKCFSCGATSGMCDSEETATEVWNERTSDTCINHEEMQANRSGNCIRPIDAYALDEAIVNCRHIDRDSVRALITDAPIVEAVAIKYGVWKPIMEEIDIPGGKKAQSLAGYRCSQCGTVEKFRKPACTCGMRMM